MSEPKPQGAVWPLDCRNEPYLEYARYIPDAGGYGVVLMLTLVPEEQSAYMRVHIDDVGGHDYGHGSIPNIPWDVACAMTGYVPAAELPPQTQTGVAMNQLNVADERQALLDERRELLGKLAACEAECAAEITLNRAVEVVYEALAKQSLPREVTRADVMDRLKDLVDYDDSDLWKRTARPVSVTCIVPLTIEVRTKPGQTLLDAVKRAGIQLRTADGELQTVVIDDVQEL